MVSRLLVVVVIAVAVVVIFAGVAASTPLATSTVPFYGKFSCCCCRYCCRCCYCLRWSCSFKSVGIWLYPSVLRITVVVVVVVAFAVLGAVA